MSLLEIKNVKKNFGGVEVLKDISLNPVPENLHFFVAQQDLRHRIMEKSIMMEHLDLCFRISICFHIIRL